MKYLGIDPDLVSSGVALSDNGKLTMLCNMAFFTLTDFVKDFEGTVVIECGYLNAKSNYHAAWSKGQSDRISKNVGEIHAIAKLLVELCKKEGKEDIAVRPTKSKVNAAYFKQVTGWEGRTNQEQRDAAMLIIGRK